MSLVLRISHVSLFLHVRLIIFFPSVKFSSHLSISHSSVHYFMLFAFLISHLRMSHAISSHCHILLAPHISPPSYFIFMLFACLISHTRTFSLHFDSCINWVHCPPGISLHVPTSTPSSARPLLASQRRCYPFFPAHLNTSKCPPLSAHPTDSGANRVRVPRAVEGAPAPTSTPSAARAQQQPPTHTTLRH